MSKNVLQWLSALFQTLFNVVNAFKHSKIFHYPLFKIFECPETLKIFQKNIFKKQTNIPVNHTVQSLDIEWAAIIFKYIFFSPFDTILLPEFKDWNNEFSKFPFLYSPFQATKWPILVLLVCICSAKTNKNINNIAIEENQL